MICAECHASIQDPETCPECGASPLLLGRFRLIEQVGAGSSGTTYRAERLEDGTRVAVKEMLMRRADSLKVLELFEREARILERLEHSGIPAYLEDFVHEAGRSTAFYLVQEFVEGKTLSERMRHPNTTEDVLKICDEVLEILTYLHAFNPPIIHRDIKPENIIERPDGRLALVDFGSVRAALDSATGGSTVAGTFGFMAPEQLLGRALPQSDVYAVGALAVALLTGKSPDTFTQNDRSIDLTTVNLPAGLRHSLMILLQPSEQSRPDAREARRILGNTQTTSVEGEGSIVVRQDLAELAVKMDRNANHVFIGPKPLQKAFLAYLDAPKPRSLPKGMDVYLLGKFSIYLMLTWLAFFALTFKAVTEGGVYESISVVSLFISILITANELHEIKARELILLEGLHESATITSITLSSFDDQYMNVRYSYRGGQRGMTTFRTPSIVGSGVQVGDHASVLVHPSDPKRSRLMLLIPQSFDFLPEETSMETLTEEGR